MLPALLVHGYREVDGRRYCGVSKEKAAAREEYDERTPNNENVGLVESRLVCVWGGGGGGGRGGVFILCIGGTVCVVLYIGNLAYRF